MAVPADPVPADFWLTAAGLAWRETEVQATPISMPFSPLIYLLMARAGLCVGDIVMASGQSRENVLRGIELMMNLTRIPSVAQRVASLQKEMPRLPIENTGEVVVFPGPSVLSFAVVIPA